MANTLKFGAGEWATKVGSTLAYNDENGNFKPLPFNFTRATSATRVNKDGLIEVVTNNKPRVDFKDDANGALLLEPERRNLNTYSDPTIAQQGNLSYASVTYQDDFNWGLGNVINNAIVFGDNSTTRYAYYSSTVSSGTVYSLSFFIKMDDNSVPIPATDFLLVLAGTSIASGYTIDNYGNNVYRVSVSGTAEASNTANGILKVASHSAKTFKITGFQLEAGSYATSYIPTQGSQVTRVAESCNQTPPSGIIGQTEGTIFVDFNINNLENQTNDPIVLSFNSSNYIEIFDNGRVNYYDGTGNIDINLPSYGLTNGRHKFGIAYNINDVAFYIDGTLAGTDTSCSPSAKSSLYLGYTNVAFLPFISYNEVKLYNTRLSNSELQQLTSL